MLEILVLVLFVWLSIKAIGIARGYPKTKNVLVKIKRECAEKLQKLKEELGGIKSDKVKPDMRSGDWMEYWYETHSKSKICPTTQLGYEATSACTSSRRLATSR